MTNDQSGIFTDAGPNNATRKARHNDDDIERVYINVPIPIDLHRRLRIRQINDGMIMRDVITAALEAWL